MLLPIILMTIGLLGLIVTVIMIKNRGQCYIDPAKVLAVAPFLWGTRVYLEGGRVVYVRGNSDKVELKLKGKL